MSSPPLRHRRVLRDNIRGITSPALKRLASRTGHVRSQSRSAVMAVRNKLKTFLTHVVGDAITYADGARKRTVDEKAVEMALERRSNLFSKKILGSPPSKRCETYGTHIKKSRSRGGSRSAAGGVARPRRKASRSKSLRRRIAFYQRQHDCLHLPKVPVSRLIREISQDFKNDIRWSSKAILLLHYAIELYVESIFHTLGILSIHRGGKGAVHEKDFLALEALEKLVGKGH